MSTDDDYALDPYCREGRHADCFPLGPCECACHTDAVDPEAVSVAFLIGSVVALFTCGAAAATGNLRGMAAAAIAAWLMAWLSGRDDVVGRPA